MATKHEVTSPTTGETFKRKSAERVYSHCVVVHFKASPARGTWAGCEAYRRAEWASTLQLANKNAASWKRDDIELVEVLPAKIV